jgi:hypothetical protein
MALIVETGAGAANSESYISVANADARQTALGNTAWTGDTAAKESALRNATIYMTGAYRSRWTGYRITASQALDWPRVGVCADYWSVASDIVPTEVANACADLAVKALTGELAPDLERGIVREKVGPLETEYDRYSPQAKRYPAIDRMLAPYLFGSSGMARLVRT